jgi:hypothetical protein
MLSLVKLLGLTLAFTSTGIVLANSTLNSFSANYSVRRGNFEAGKATVRFKNTNNQFHYHSVTKPTGIVSVFASDTITETSQGTISNNRFKPASYNFTHKKGKKLKRFIKVAFDWNKNTAHWQSRKYGNKTISLSPGVIDRFIMQVAVMKDLNSKQKEFTYTVTDKGKLKRYRLRVIGTEKIKTPAGTFTTVKIKRIRSKKKNKSTYMWCAPKLGNLLVKITQVNRKGAKNTMVLTGYSRK